MMKFMLGLGLGVVVGSLIAPASGEETRRQIVEKAEQFRDQRLGKMIQMGRQKSGDLGREAGQKAFDEAAKKVVGEETFREAEQRRA